MSLRNLDKIPDISALYWPQREDYVAFKRTDEYDGIAGAHELNNASRLLNLPRELRGMIYGYFLEAYRPAPPSPPFAGPRIFRLDDEGAPFRDISYPISLTKTNIVALLGTSFTIRSEILELVDKKNDKQRSPHAELDIMATGYIFHPLWTRLPTLPSRDTALNVTVRLRVFSSEAFRANDGWPRQPGVAFRNLLTLLTQFMHCGPAFTQLLGPSKPVSAIDTLTVRLSNYDIYTPRMFPPAVYETVRACKALSLRPDVGMSLRKLSVVAEDPEGKVPGFEGREWTYDVVECRSDGDEEDLLRISVWEDMGFSLEPDAARFNFG